MMRIGLIIPTRNAAPWTDRLIPAIHAQTVQPDSWLVVDSGSADDTAHQFRAAGAEVRVIHPASFNHGGTREWARQHVEADLLVYLTQDAIPHPDCFARLQAAFLSPEVGVAYARQLPRAGAGIVEAHARAFNYPPHERSKSLRDVQELGIKTCFSSDSCAAYRATALQKIGGFPLDVIGSEDAFVAGKMLLSGFNVYYAAQACVEHSHHYSITEEFKRYFDIGVFYGRERWIAEAFGAATGEGKRFIMSEIRALLATKEWYFLPHLMLRNAAKLAGYHLGRNEHRLSTDLKRRISMFPGYWKTNEF